MTAINLKNVPAGVVPPYGVTAGAGSFEVRALRNSKNEINRQPHAGKPYNTITFEQIRTATAYPHIFAEKANAPWMLASIYNGPDARTFSTMVRPDGSWTSRSESDQLAAAPHRRAVGLGLLSPGGGCHGDTFDVITHFLFRNNRSAALKWATAERHKVLQQTPMMQNIMRHFGGLPQ